MTRSFVARCGAVALLLSGAGCAATGRPGEASSYLMVESFLAASGARATTFGGTLGSDVQTLVNTSVNGVQMRVPTVFEDVGQVRFRLAMKNPSVATSAANAITVTRYRVVFRRADGRNTPGVDVPFGFDGALTVTVGAEPVSAAFTLVRIQAKSESPLLALIGGGGAMAISTLAEITFYGTDQAGRDVVATAHISVNFADWGDPE
jgi:hypothetical protein